MGDHPLFSLVVATWGRSAELERLLESLAAQTLKDFEVIVVDQNPDDTARRVAEAYRERLPLRLLPSPRGASRARNRGMAEARGRYLAFPDDDGWYPSDLLERVAEAFTRHGERWDGFMVRIVDGSGRGLPHRPFLSPPKEPTPLVPRDAFYRVGAHGLFLKREAAAPFDPDLGPGAGTPWVAGEEADMVLEAMARGYRFLLLPEIAVFHPIKDEVSTPERTRAYHRGIGRVLRKRHLLGLFLYGSLRSLAGLLLSLARMDFKRARHYGQAFLGRVEGWLGVCLR